MADVTFVHVWDTPNVGDQWCSPKSYFDFGRADTRSFGAVLQPADAVIYGGGQIFGRVAASMRMHAKAINKKVVWGVGIDNTHAATPKFQSMAKAASLMSSRNKGVVGCDWVPCVSAMSGNFDLETEPSHDSVLFSHATKSDGLARVSGMPELTNYGCSMEEAIRFIASGETVVTNSYHGTYWAMCLGRKVLCVPFSDKFSGFESDPVKAGPDEWPDHLHLAQAREGVLEHARAKNRMFYEKVMNIL